jgi:outer membrane protein OmpA-like peptidoglycan-associated protein
MKKMLFSLGICFGILTFCAEAKSNYVVIGAFSSQGNAEKFTAAAITNNYAAKFAVNPVRNLFYVYILQTNNWQQASGEALRLRAQSGYTDAWVFIGVLGDVAVADATDMNPETGKPLGVVEDMSAKTDPTVSLPPPDSVSVVTASAEVVEQTPVTATDPQATTKNFLFKVLRLSDQQLVDGDINLVNIENQRVSATHKGNNLISMKAPNKSGDMRLECDIAGYRKSIQLVNFKNPAANDGVVIDDDVITVPFELVRLQKGDVAIMYNVFFYKDAAIMRPESKYDLDGLVHMMKENDNYRVKIHGHTNGKAAGKIIEPGEDRNLFSLTNSTDSRGSAKKLSEERALIIREYLVSQGIDEKRMEIKAWGGKKPIYERDHAQAGANVRVEIEVIQD